MPSEKGVCSLCWCYCSKVYALNLILLMPIHSLELLVYFKKNLCAKCVINMAQGVKLNRLAIMVGDFHESTSTQAGVLSLPVYVNLYIHMNDILFEETDS